MKALVTGGNGFTGSHLIDRLLAEGIGVRCLVRPTSNRAWLQGKAVEFIECDDLGNAERVKQAVRGVDLVFHVLGTLVARDLDEYRRVNVAPVGQLLAACAGSPSLKRFVLIGSQGAAGPNPPGIERLGEDDPCRPVSAYGESKREAEELTRQYQGIVPFTIVRPSVMYGPRDKTLLTLFQTAKRKGWIPQVGRQPKTISLAHAQDVVDGIYRAAVSEKAIGRTYFLASDEGYSADEVCASLAAAIGAPVRTKVIPGLVVKTLALYADLVSRVLHKNLLLNRDRLATLSYPRWVCDVSRARRDLGFQPRISLSNGFRDTYQWYCSERWL